jgi:hypothetical protein
MDATLVRNRQAGAMPTPAGRIDELVFGRLKRLGMRPSPLCSDEVFLRRVYVDVIGVIPTSDEVRTFLKDSNPAKRAQVIDSLLSREEFADYWSMKWSDTLRVKSEFPINLWPLAAQAYHHWIRTALEENWSYDRFARSLLLSAGSNFRDPEVNFYRAVTSKKPDTIARAVALTFMGERAEKWPKAKLAQMAQFFALVGYKPTHEWKEEIVYHDLSKGPRRPVIATLPDGKTVKLLPDNDHRQAFVDWLVSAQNPWFARNAVNRVWYWLMGRGLIEEPDDIRPDNPPSNPELLSYLERVLVNEKFDVKQVYRQILDSSTYQLSSTPLGSDPRAVDEFARYRVRRLEAEVLIDAIDQITGTTESYSSVTPEPYTFIPESQRSVLLADGSITSSFLEMFGRPSRDTGLQSERNNNVTADQRLHMLNSSHIQRKIERGPNILATIRTHKNAGDLVDELYLAILSRFPNSTERDIALGYIHRTASRQTGAIDLAWAMLNNSEFLYRH